MSRCYRKVGKQRKGYVFMSRVMIHGLSIESTEMLKRKLDIGVDGLEFFTSTDFDKTKDIVTERAVNLLILECEAYGKRETNTIKDFRIWGLSFPVLVISNNVAASNVEISHVPGRTDNKPHFLEINFEDKKLMGLVKKLLRTKNIPQQLHRPQEFLH